MRGGSTITQQLAKNLYLSTSKNPLRKLREFLIARRLEEELGKRRILEIYLNVIEWGDGIYGAEAASHAYFGKPSKDLSVREAVLLAAVIPNPRRMNPSRPSRRVEYRFDLILSRMHQYRQISDQEFESAQKESSDRGATHHHGKGPWELKLACEAIELASSEARRAFTILWRRTMKRHLGVRPTDHDAEDSRCKARTNSCRSARCTGFHSRGREGCRHGDGVTGTRVDLGWRAGPTEEPGRVSGTDAGSRAAGTGRHSVDVRQQP